MSRTALAFAQEAMAQYGVPVPAVGRDHVRVSVSQQELARANRCSPSTVSWYLRRLGPAVVTRRPGIVFDREALMRLGTTRRSLAPRTVAVERQLLDAFARPAADGTRRQLLSGSADRPATLQDIAAHLGINRSSAHRHVSALEQAGHLERQGRRLYLTTPSNPPTKECPVDEHPPPSSGTSYSPVPTGQILELLDKVADVMGLVAGIASQLLSASQIASDDADEPRLAGAHPPRPFGAQTATGPGLRAAGAADHPRGSSPDFDLIGKNDVEITSNHSPLRAQESRPVDTVRAEGPRNTGGPDWTVADLPQLLATLLAECDRLGLPGVADPQRVLDALRPYRAEQVAAAARQMAVDLRSGAPMRSPIAILVRKAEAGDPYYFRSTPDPEPAPPPPVLVEVEDPIDEEAQAAVAALDEQALRRLDAAVGIHVRALLGDSMAATALRSQGTLTYWRPIVWRSQDHATTRAEEQR